MSAASRPNFLLIMSDQHNRRFMGCAGDPIVHTPTLDRLAARGVRFENTYCQFPLCGPSRMSFMTARQPHEINCITNLCWLSSDIPTFAHAFGAAGYETILAGRMHFVGSDQRHGFDQRIIADVPGSAFINPVTGWHLKDVLGTLVDTPGMGPAPLIKSGPGRTGYHAYDEAVADRAVDWLRSGGAGSRSPFMLVVGFASPHSPFVAPPNDFYRYNDKIRIEDLPDSHLDAIHPIHHQYRKGWGIEKDVDKESQRRTRVSYYGLCTFLDRQVGRVLQALEESGQAENTIVVYTSDHGEQLGEHGLWWKSTFYDDSAGVPLIIAGPGIGAVGSTIHQNVGLIDLPPTLLDLVGANPIPGASGRSFRCLIENHPRDWPDEIFAENFGGIGEKTAQRMIRHGPWKLNYYHGMRPQLFNIEEDPRELNDRWNDLTCRQVLADLQARVLEKWDPARMEDRFELRQNELRLIGEWVKRNRPPEPDPLWCDKPLDNHIETVR